MTQRSKQMNNYLVFLKDDDVPYLVEADCLKQAERKIQRHLLNGGPITVSSWEILTRTAPRNAVLVR